MLPTLPRAVPAVALLAALALHAPRAAAQAEEGVRVSEGPWGRLELTPVRIRVPEEMVPAEPLPLAPWHFGDRSRAAVERELRRAGVGATLVSELLETAGTDPGVLHPDAAQRMALPPEVRARLYALLAERPENTHQVYPTKLPRDHFERRFRGLEPETRRQLEAFLYARPSAPGSWLLADLPALTHLVADREERLRLVQATSLRESVLMRLHVDAGTDVAALAGWWGRGGRRRDLETLLRSVQDVAGGYELDALLLLPPQARALAYTYPPPERAAARDCFWTVVGFFDPPGAGPDPDRVERELRRMRRVTGPLQLGDVLVLASRGELVHAAVYVADDVYFTKNGGHFSVPWIFMRREDLLELYDDVDRDGLAHYRRTELD